MNDGNKKRKLWQDIDPDENITDLTCSPDAADVNVSTTSDADFVDYLDDFEATQDTSPNKAHHGTSSPIRPSPSKSHNINHTSPNNNFKANNPNLHSHSTTNSMPHSNNTPHSHLQSENTPNQKLRGKLKLNRNTSKPPSALMAPDYEYSVPSFSVFRSNSDQDSSKVSDTTFKTFSRVPSPPVFEEPGTPTNSFNRSTSSSFRTLSSSSIANTTTTTATTITTATSANSPSSRSSISTPPKSTHTTSDPKMYSSPEDEDFPPANFFASLNPKPEPTVSPHFKRLKKISSDGNTNSTTSFLGKSTPHAPFQSLKSPKPDPAQSTPSISQQSPQSTKHPTSKKGNGVNLDLMMDDTVDSSQVAMSECPICFQKVPTNFLETHAQQELDALEQAKLEVLNKQEATHTKLRESPHAPPAPLLSPPASPSLRTSRTRSRAPKREKPKPTPKPKRRRNIF